MRRVGPTDAHRKPSAPWMVDFRCDWSSALEKSDDRSRRRREFRARNGTAAMARKPTSIQAVAPSANDVSSLDTPRSSRYFRQVGGQVTKRHDPHRHHPSRLQRIAATMPVGSVAVEPALDEKGERLIWLAAHPQQAQRHARQGRELQRRDLEVGSGRIRVAVRVLTRKPRLVCLFFPRRRCYAQRRRG
jgi:hypothetical protein